MQSQNMKKAVAEQAKSRASSGAIRRPSSMVELDPAKKAKSSQKTFQRGVSFDPNILEESKQQKQKQQQHDDRKESATSAQPARDIGLRNANLVQARASDEGGMRFVLFLEKTSIQWTPELDHIAERVYASARDPALHVPKEPRKPFTSGYGFEQIMKEDKAPPEPPSQGGWFGDVLAQRRKRLRWEAHMEFLGKKATIIQALARRFLARLELFERRRLKTLEGKRQRIKELQEYIDTIPQKTKVHLENLEKEHAVIRSQLKDVVFDQFKLYGRQLIEETRALGQALPELRRESRKLQAENTALCAEIEKAHTSTFRLHETSEMLKRVASEYKMLLDYDKQELEINREMGIVELHLRQMFEDGVRRLASRIEATSKEKELVESIKAMELDCQRKVAFHTPAVIANY